MIWLTCKSLRFSKHSMLPLTKIKNFPNETRSLPKNNCSHSSSTGEERPSDYNKRSKSLSSAFWHRGEQASSGDFWRSAFHHEWNFHSSIVQKAGWYFSNLPKIVKKFYEKNPFWRKLPMNSYNSYVKAHLIACYCIIGADNSLHW